MPILNIRPPALSTRSAGRPPPTPPPTTPKPANRRRGGAPKKRREPYPTPAKKLDIPPVPTYIPEDEEASEEEDDKEEGDKEDEDKGEEEGEEEDNPDSGNTTTPIPMDQSDGGLFSPTFLEKEDILTPSREEQREEQRRAKERQSQLQYERITREEFARLIYAVEWFVYYKDVEVYRDTSYYSISGTDTIDFAEEFGSIVVKGRQYGQQEGKVAYLVKVNASLTNHGKDKTFFRLEDSDINTIWRLKIEKAMRLKYSSRSKKATVAFKVFVEFWYACTPSGIIPEYMKPTVPMT